MQRFLLRFGWLLPVGSILVGIAILVLTYAFASIPLPKDIKLSSSAQVFDVNGDKIGIYSGEVRRFLIDTGKLLDKKPYIGEAVIAAEDRDFYSHNGVSIKGIIRAAWANVTGGEIAQGGSTITQQYIKQAVLQDPERTITRKVKEAILAIKLERRYSKRQILGFYLNTIYLGRGAYGIEAAARTYFARSAEELTLGQAAYLAGIIPAPNSYQPDDNPEGAKGRRDRVLDLMAQEGFITPAEADEASRGKIQLREGADSSTPTTQTAAYFMEWLRKDYLYPMFKEELYTRGLEIHTTLDLNMQDMAERAVEGILTEKSDPQAALVSMTPRGEVRALVGSSRDFENIKKARGFNYASGYPGRQAGSAFKPFTLLTAIQEGISLNSRFSGRSPVQIPEPCAGENGLPPWTVENYGGGSYGTLTLDQATTNSVNTIFAQLIHTVGPEKVVDTLNALQFDRDDAGAERVINPDCGLALGILDVTPLEMARAYATFAGRGRMPEVMPITYIEDAEGNCIVDFRDVRNNCEDDRQLEFDQVVDQNSVDVMTQALTHVVQSGTATVANIGRPVAGKTGTAQANRNAWFAGYVPQLATVVWEGYPVESGPDKKIGTIDDIVPEMRYCSDPVLCRPVHGYEVTGGGAPVSPAVIWANFMREATVDLEPLPFPIPTDLPDKVINSPAPTPTPTKTPKPRKTPKPEPTVVVTPTIEPTPTAEPTPTGQPTIAPTPSQDAGAQGSGGDP
jgi:penicillin-binding protein 1A